MGDEGVVLALTEDGHLGRDGITLKPKKRLEVGFVDRSNRDHAASLRA